MEAEDIEESKSVEETTCINSGTSPSNSGRRASLTSHELEEFVVAYLKFNLRNTYELDDNVINSALQNEQSSRSFRKFTGQENSLSVLYIRIEERDISILDENSLSNLPLENWSDIRAIVLKSQAKLIPSSSYSGQLQFITLGSKSLQKQLETLYSYIHAGFLPLITTIESKLPALEEDTDLLHIKSNRVETCGRNPREQSGISIQVEASVKANLPVIRKRLNDLDFAMRNCLYGVQVPEIQLQVDPLISSILIQYPDATSTKCNIDLESIGLGKEKRDIKFLNALQAGVNKWVRDIQRVTKMERKINPSSVLEEIHFWQEYDRALNFIYSQVETPGVLLTMEVLKQSGRALATILFKNDTGLDEAKKRVAGNMILMHDFPVNALVSSSDIPQLSFALSQIFSHLKKIKSIEGFSLEQGIKLVQMLSNDLLRLIVSILKPKKLLMLEFSAFEAHIRDVKSVFNCWDDLSRQFRDMLRQLAKRRSERIGGKLVYKHYMLQTRLNDIFAFREAHAKLKKIVHRVLKTELSCTMNLILVLDEAYDQMLGLDALDVTEEGKLAWDAGLKKYENKINKIETQIIENITKKLATAKSAEDMFRIFSRLTPLFVRPRIRGATHQFQAKLVTHVKSDIEALQMRFKKGYLRSQAFRMSKVRDIPRVSGAIIWARQIERQLKTYLNRVELILGEGWEGHLDGRKIKEIANAFVQKLDTQVMFDQWISGIQSVSKFEVSGRLFKIGKDGGKFVLQTNFDSHVVELFKEVRNLQYLGFRIPYTLKVVSDEAREKYPYATWLYATQRTYETTMMDLRDPELFNLLTAFNMQVQRVVSRAFSKGHYVNWDSDGLEDYVKEFSEAVLNLQDKVGECKTKRDFIHESIDKLKNCIYEHTTFKEILSSIQNTLDEMNFVSYSNIEEWTENLESEVKSILMMRVEKQISCWVNSSKFKYYHELTLENQNVQIAPPLQSTLCKIILQLNSIINVVCGLPSLKSSHYDSVTEQNEPCYSSMVHNIKNLSSAVYRICENVNNAKAYCKSWLQYQALWTLDTTEIDHITQNKLTRWNQLLREIKAARKTFESSKFSKNFGAIIIDYRQIQAQVSLRYDAWQRELLTKYAETMQISMKRFYASVAEIREELERSSVLCNSEDITSIIVFIHQTRENIGNMSVELKEYETAEKLLKNNRYPFAIDWLWCANVSSEWKALQQILIRRTTEFEEDYSQLEQTLLSRDQILQERKEEIIKQWQKQRPIDGECTPMAALNSIKVFEEKSKQLLREQDHINDAKTVLKLSTDMDKRDLEKILSEQQSLKELWKSISEPCSLMEDFKGKLWSVVVPRELSASLDEVLEKLLHAPDRVRKFQAFDFVQNKVRTWKKFIPVLSDMKSEALKDRHWKTILKILKLPLDEKVKLGDLLNKNLEAFEIQVKDVLKVAHGERAIEEYILMIRNTWVQLQFDLIDYKNRTCLVRGWAELVKNVEDHENALHSMKKSPYFARFEDEANSWQDKLSKIKSGADLWQMVQHKWLYLEGIFFSSGDIRKQLPSEFARFKAIDSEYTSLMKAVRKASYVLEFMLNFDSLEKTLLRLKQMLEKIQKSLGSFLEAQRYNFPRFYFVGDEDLLEIIGNARDLGKLQRHLSKMFAGIHSLEMKQLDCEKIAVTAMISREGEVVNFADNGIEFLSTDKACEKLRKVEEAMFSCLKMLLSEAVTSNPFIRQDILSLSDWIERFPMQIILLASQIYLSRIVECMKEQELQKNLNFVEECLSELAQTVMLALTSLQRKKREQLITELVRQRDVLRKVLRSRNGKDSFAWLSQIRYTYEYGTDRHTDVLVNIADFSFNYGFEYQGLRDKLVQTHLTDKCYLALCQALHFRLGGNPFGPAGTGKTESVKALGAHLGRFVLVFNCADNFDLPAMSRLFRGLCQVGAWGCFDEFNRLEERILSTVSEQILCIQKGLLNGVNKINLSGQDITLNENVGLFVTLNPGYAGRSNLPNNLKQLFRGIAMVRPDHKIIAQVILFSQGFKHAEDLSRKITELFDECRIKLSKQPHYDFGLRSVKSVLVSAGNMQRSFISKPQKVNRTEEEILVKTICETLMPKLILEDVSIFKSIISDVFQDITLELFDNKILYNAVIEIIEEEKLSAIDAWINKIIQLNQVLDLHHGVMMVGPAGSGKSTSWKVLIKALDHIDRCRSEFHIIDPKALTKNNLYGFLDSTTLEWTDGIFTRILRTVSITDHLPGERKRCWIVFDGDVDPEWAENLNSLLDDNKILTLPSGERLQLPENVRILFETETLKHATQATVSRCGMVWYSEDTLPVLSILAKFGKEQYLLQDFDLCGLIQVVLDEVLELKHCMERSRISILNSVTSLFEAGCAYCDDYETAFTIASEHRKSFLSKWMIFSLLWGAAGSLPSKEREKIARSISEKTTVPVPQLEGMSLFDYEVRLADGEWHLWSEGLDETDLASYKIMDTESIIQTVDTARHAQLVHAFLERNKPFVLCGPPGSGKTMSLNNVLQSSPNLDVAYLNFSSKTTPDTILRTMEQHCVYTTQRNSTILAPEQPGKKLVVFCDEVNIAEEDKYGTQKVISFMRQIIEHHGYWRKDNKWIRVKNIQFISACNPPTDPGRFPLSMRFLRSAPVIFVDYPAEESLKKIYSTFVSAMLKMRPGLNKFVTSITNAMIEIYLWNARNFDRRKQPHYIYSPRELTKWIRSMSTASFDTAEEMLRLWYHEGLRLFHDKLVTANERTACIKEFDLVVTEYFPSVDKSCLEKPIYYSSWLNKDYVSVSRKALKEYVEARLQYFYEEELNIPLVVFDEVLDHIVRIDRVLKQPFGHLLLIGESGCGKTVLSRFVAWMNGMKIFQLKISRSYSAEEFDEDLRNVMKQAGCYDKKVCFIFDESNALQTSFLEKMNALLASGCIPGLFQGEEMHSLVAACRQTFGMVDSQEECFAAFTRRVQTNLHVVFTMNPTNSDLGSHARASPALFNRCYINWVGSWSDEALHQVATQFTSNIELDILPGTLVQIHRSFSDKRNSRDYLEMINHLMKIYSAKRKELEAQQLSFNQGLKKLKESADELRTLQVELDKQAKELKEKDKEASQKLGEIVSQQNEAERKKFEAEKLSEQLNKQTKEVNQQQEIAEAQLARARPALREAQKAVSEIKTAHLQELRALRSPPEPVRWTLEAVLQMLDLSYCSWQDIRRVLQKKDFVHDIVNFQSENLKDESLQNVKALLGNEGFAEDKVSHASTACHSLFKWIVSQINMSEMLSKVKPLQEKIESLKSESSIIEAEYQIEINRIQELEKAILTLKSDYALLIKNIEQTKTEMEKVSTKVDRSKDLLEQLAEEQSRWQKSTERFSKNVENLLGDSVLSSAFLAYAGGCTWAERQNLILTWKNILLDLGIPFEDDLSIVSYLNQNVQVKDEIIMENESILTNFIRYPLIIDPTGDNLGRLCQEEAIQKTSFLDKAFLKHLESALRFGTKILIEDAEYYDPILGPVLNREVHRAGGRMLIRLGKEDIDFSPSFAIYLSTENSSACIHPDLKSCVTLVNFTETASSLHNRSLTALLKSREPELERKRIDSLKLQGEYRTKLNELERNLLTELSSCKGKLLEQDSLLRCLEKIKSEAHVVESKFQENQRVKESILQAMAKYKSVANVFVRVYFAIQKLSSISSLYHWSLTHFLQMVETVLQENITPDGIVEAFLKEIFLNISPGLYYRDKMLLALLLLRIKEPGVANELLHLDCSTRFNSIRDRAIQYFGEFPELEEAITYARPVLVIKCEGTQFTSPEGYDIFSLGEENREDSIKISSSKRVCLQNIHLVPEWIEKMWKSLSCKDIILVAEISERSLPLKIVSSCSKILLEQSLSVRNLMLQKLRHFTSLMEKVSGYERFFIFKTIRTWSILRVRNKYKRKQSVVQDLDLQLAISTIIDMCQISNDSDVFIEFITQLFVSKISHPEELKEVTNLICRKMKELQHLDGCKTAELIQWTKRLCDTDTLEDLDLSVEAEKCALVEDGNYVSAAIAQIDSNNEEDMKWLK